MAGKPNKIKYAVKDSDGKVLEKFRLYTTALTWMQQNRWVYSGKQIRLVRL